MSAIVIVAAATLVVTGGVFYMTLPVDAGFFSYFTSALWSLLTLLIIWVFVLPLALSMAFESLVRKTCTDHGYETASEQMIAGIRSGIRVLFRTLGWRLLWPAAAFVCSFIPILAPFGVLLSAIGLGHITCIDACDLALSIQGKDGTSRTDFLREHKQTLLQSGMVAGLLHIGLGFTFILWPFFLPAIFCGAAIWAPAQNKQREEAKQVTE